jgi:branched-chain amino acid transport system permease protein
MALASILQYLVSGLMLAMIYALMAVGFTLFFGVLNIIHFAHGDVFTFGAFTALAGYLALSALGLEQSWLLLALILVFSAVMLSLLGGLTALGIVLPLKGAPPLNVLLATMMLGTALRESIRLFYPEGANPQKFPALLPTGKLMIGTFPLRIDNCIMLAFGLGVVAGTSLLLNKTRLGLAMRAVAQDEEAARMMGVNFTLIVVSTFALGASLAAAAGIVSGLYYHEISFSMGLMTGAIGFCAAIIGGLGNFYGAILGGVIIAFLQTLGAVAIPFASAYKDVFMFIVVIGLITWRPTGLIQEHSGDRV